MSDTSRENDNAHWTGRIVAVCIAATIISGVWAAALNSTADRAVRAAAYACTGASNAH